MMDNIGAEVGQKMRSAIKAKLMELNCYVDDELPDYIMVMVANKRSKSQMNEDLNLFLSSQTSTFVDWLHIVLKKLKEVTVTNPDVYKKNAKRKSGESVASNIKLKKEKKEKKSKKEIPGLKQESDNKQVTSLTDDLPVHANKLAEQRKIVIINETRCNNVSSIENDGFDIPLLHEVNESSEQELQEIENKIRNVKSRLGLLVESEDEDDEDCLNIKAEKEDLELSKEKEVVKPKPTNTEASKVVEKTPERPKTPVIEVDKRQNHKRITYSPDTTPPRKSSSILNRLGKRSANDDSRSPRKKVSLSEARENEKKSFKSSKRDRSRDDSRGSSRRRTRDERERRNSPKETVLKRLGVMSKVSIPQKKPEEPELEVAPREVPSIIKVKPRVIPSDTKQANKNLLLKAVADAQRSVAQTPTVGNNSTKTTPLFTKKFKERAKEEQPTARKLSEAEKNKVKSILTKSAIKEKPVIIEATSTIEYIPTPIVKPVSKPEEVSTTKPQNTLEENGEMKHQFIVTLDGIDKTKFKDLEEKSPVKMPVKARLDGRKTPSPIIFDKIPGPVVAPAKSNIPDKLPIVHPSLAIKNKERCKYWPVCRQGDKCEFAHPTTNCEMFPNCKFGDKCVYIHPNCKFGSSCTKRDCRYSHNFKQKIVTSSLPIIPTVQTCKFYPHCTNLNCPFFHPKLCKFGKYCKNPSSCTYSHNFVHTKSSLTWRAN